MTLFREEGVEQTRRRSRADVRYATFDALMKSARRAAPSRAALEVGSAIDASPRQARAARAALRRARRPPLRPARARRPQPAPEAEQGAHRHRAARPGVRRATATLEKKIREDEEALADPELARARRGRAPRARRPSARALEEQIQLLLLPTDPNDKKNIILEIRGGEGGEEAALFAADLFRMYCALRRDARAGRSRSSSLSESATGGYKEVHRARHRQGRLLAAALRGRRAPRAARAGDRDAGAHPHLDGDGRRAARGRRRRRPDRRQGSRDLDRRERRAGRAGRQHDEQRRADPAQADRASSSSARTSARSSRTRRRR